MRCLAIGGSRDGMVVPIPYNFLFHAIQFPVTRDKLVSLDSEEPVDISYDVETYLLERLGDHKILVHESLSTTELFGRLLSCYERKGHLNESA